MFRDWAKPLFEPRSMREAPPLDPAARPGVRKSRHALLINPFYPKDPHASFGKHVLTPSLSLTAIAGATPAGWTVDFWDENLLQGPPPLDPFPTIVGITVHLTFAKRAYRLAQWYRERGAAVVLGGMHVLGCPEECAPHADALALGEGVQLWPVILRDAEAGNLKPRYAGSYGEPCANDPPPRRSILPADGFLTAASLIATRGCVNRCGFCYLATEGLRMPCQSLPPERVVDGFVQTGEPYGVFIDNNLGANRRYLRELCRALEPAGKIWSAAVTADLGLDETAVDAMARAGCVGVFVGFETLSGENLDEAGKRSPRPEEYARAVDAFHRRGIQVNGSFVLGFDADGPDVFGRAVDWIEANRLECATFHILTPYPGTPCFKRMKRDGRLLHTDWERYDTAHAVFIPARMAPEELEAGYAWCYRRIFSHRSIWRRRPADSADWPGYLLMSYLYKRCNPLWPVLIRNRWTHAAWRPLVEAARRRNLARREAAAAAWEEDEGESVDNVEMGQSKQHIKIAQNATWTKANPLTTWKWETRSGTRTRGKQCRPEDSKRAAGLMPDGVGSTLEKNRYGEPSNPSRRRGTIRRRRFRRPRGRSDGFRTAAASACR